MQDTKAIIHTSHTGEREAQGAVWALNGYITLICIVHDVCFQEKIFQIFFICVRKQYMKHAYRHLATIGTLPFNTAYSKSVHLDTY